MLAISIGDTAEFFVEPERNSSTREYITLKSGGKTVNYTKEMVDAVIFNGGQLYHGVSKILPNTAPAFWKAHGIQNNMARFNLQFRDPTHDASKLLYYPFFKTYDD